VASTDRPCCLSSAHFAEQVSSTLAAFRYSCSVSSVRFLEPGEVRFLVRAVHVHSAEVIAHRILRRCGLGCWLLDQTQVISNSPLRMRSIPSFWNPSETGDLGNGTVDSSHASSQMAGPFGVRCCAMRNVSN